jgi:sporulation protein YlmC with PRC-barrel domain
MTTPAGRVLDLHLQFLDRQVVDVDGEPVCKVDDLELELDDDGRPYVTAILIGPRALGPRLGGRLGRWIAAIAARLAEKETETSATQRLDFGLVTEIDSAITVSRPVAELAVRPLEKWVDDHVIARIPGSRDASR